MSTDVLHTGLELDTVHARFGLVGASLRATRGEVMAIVGPNGAGKTTLLECIAALRETTRGAVRWDGRELGSARDRARVLAYLPDEVVLPDEMPMVGVSPVFPAP